MRLPFPPYRGRHSGHIFVKSYYTSALSAVKADARLSLHDTDIGQMAIFLGVVGAVADDKYVVDREADKIDRDLDLASLWLVEQGTCPEISDPVLSQLG